MHKTFSQTIAAEFSEIRAASTASGGTALTSTLGLIPITLGANWISITPRNFVGATVARFLLNPYLVILRTQNSLATAPSDISVELQDGDTTDVALDAQDTAANGDFIYVGAHLPFAGARVTAGSDPQNTASNLTVKYWNGNWTDISATDGSTSGGASFAITGNVTWTVPAAWTKKSLVAIGDTTLTSQSSLIAPLYWTRWEFSAATEATWNVVGLQAINRSTSYAELLEGQSFQQSIQSEGPGGIASVQALTDAGTANLVVNVATGRGENWE